MARVVAPAAERTDRAPLAAALGAAAIVLAAFGLYAALGEPRAVHGNARAHLEDRPADGRGWTLLAREEFGRGRYAESAAAFERAVSSRKVAGDAAVWCEYADAVGMAQGRRLAGKPAELIARALAIDAAHPCALEMAGSLAVESGNHSAAAGYWRQLLPRLPSGSPEHRELSAAVARAERLAMR